MTPAVLLRIEGLVLAALSVFLFDRVGASWWLFLAWLAPDLSFAGYLAGPRIGALVYNTAHAFVLPGALVTWGVIQGSDPLIGLGLVWFSHIGVDRLAGYGLKYPTAFKDTHLQRV